LLWERQDSMTTFASASVWKISPFSSSSRSFALKPRQISPLMIQSAACSGPEGLIAEHPGLFDLAERYAALSRTGDPLERLAVVVHLEVCRADLDTALARSDRSKVGRPPMDTVMLFKVLVLQALYGLADERTEFQIRDRLSFMRFLVLDLSGDGRIHHPPSVLHFTMELTESLSRARSAV
jgi:hypothetical protein